jgi:pantetheine-phosphate adenylyltransferase
LPTTAVFPGTFDPPTLGHRDLLERSARMFDRVVVAVAAGHHKKTMFTLDERLAMAREAAARLRNVTVQPFEGLMNEFVLDLPPKRGHKVVVRGVRGSVDYDYEVQLAGMNRERHAAIETVFLMPGTAFQFLSSSRVREIATLGGDVSRWVTPAVARRVRSKVAAAR